MHESTCDNKAARELVSSLLSYIAQVGLDLHLDPLPSLLASIEIAVIIALL